MKRNTVEFIREGQYAAEVDVELIEDETGWSPYLSLDDAKKLDAVRLAMRSGDVAAAFPAGPRVQDAARGGIASEIVAQGTPEEVAKVARSCPGNISSRC
jgi:hypothetical protein